ncbi:LCP family protein [Streptomyces coeruleofuscus]|uniref:Cell envelope-related transcriptional attenuator domain-containing protein n=1 Tax=Streptomyces coeruleofuscus TaxID=66879 RepID=A0ABN3HM06_9ACTN
MSDGPGMWPGTGRRNDTGEAHVPRVITGPVWQGGTPPLQEPVRPYEGYIVGPYPYGSYDGSDLGPYPYGSHDGASLGSSPSPRPPSSPSPSPYPEPEVTTYGSPVDETDRDQVREAERGGRTTSTRPPRERPGRARRTVRLLAALLCALALTGAGTCAWAEYRLDRSVDLSGAADRPLRGKGTNYLIVGSDGRDGLSEQARKELHTGTAGGSRTDSMMLLHTGAHGTSMVSLPRDSWVTIPSYVDPDTGKFHRAAKNKLNAAYSLGGPAMLVRTVERNTGLRVDHYAEIGFGGFVGVVDAVGGVEMCVDRTIDDPKSGLRLKKGCHNLTGSQALAFVRQRHQEADGDLGRSRNQRQFLSALARKAAAPGVVLDPFRTYPALSAGLDALVVDKDMELPTLLSLFRAMKSVSGGSGRQLNVPVAGPGSVTAGSSALTWDEAKANKLFAELRDDRPVSIDEPG